MIKNFLKKIPYLKYFLNKIRNKITQIKKVVRIYLVQRRFKKIIKLKKEKIFNGKKIRVAFFVTQKQLWNSQTVYDNFLSNNLFEPFIVAFPNRDDNINCEKNTCKDNYDFFKRKKMNVIFGYDMDNELFFSLNDIDADIIFYDQPSPNGFPVGLSWGNTSKTSLICYVPYGYKIAKSYEAHFNSELHNNCWLIFAESIWHKEQFKKFGKVKGRNVVVSGYPKLDVYNNEKSDSNERYKKQKYKKTIIWAPHWTVKHSFIEYATFDKYYKFFLQQAIDNKNIFWIFKPHQTLRYYLERINFMTRHDINKYYEQWDKLSNGRFFDNSDYFDLFKESDALITDCGSFLAEYLPTENPILLLVNDNSPGYNEIGNKLVSTYYKAFNKKDIEKFVNNVVINDNDFLKEKRLKNLNLVQPNRNGAGKFIVNYIQKVLM